MQSEIVCVLADLVRTNPSEADQSCQFENIPATAVRYHATREASSTAKVNCCAERVPSKEHVVSMRIFCSRNSRVGSSASNGQSVPPTFGLPANFCSDHCRVMVRIYANLAGLSKAVSKAKLCGAEKRALAPFVASFNRSNDLFDFVDAGELKENADFKIRAMFVSISLFHRSCRHENSRFGLAMNGNIRSARVSPHSGERLCHSEGLRWY